MTTAELGEGFGSREITWEELGKALDHSLARSGVDWGVGCMGILYEWVFGNVDDVGFWCNWMVLLVQPALGARKKGHSEGRKSRSRGPKKW